MFAQNTDELSCPHLSRILYSILSAPDGTKYKYDQGRDQVSGIRESHRAVTIISY